MSMHKFHLLGCFLVCTALAACASHKPTMTKLVAKDSGSTVHIREGDILEIALEGNPTTGYTWEVAPAIGALLVQQGEGEYKAESSALGAGGIVTLRFKAIEKGTAELKLIYHRTFEPNVPPLRTFDIKIIVDK